MSGKAILGSKLDKIAALIADETITKSTELSLVEKCAVLKTLDAHYATVHKIEPNEEVGGAFARYRKDITTASSGRERNSRDAGNGSDSDSELGEDALEPLELDGK